jgi:LPS export ABC transporter protein LptC
MKKTYLLGAGFVVALAALGVWVAGTGKSTTSTAAADTENTDAAYDYDAHDVVVRQMGPDGALQYEVVAKQVTQQPRNGRITASELTMHHDPAGTTPGGPLRWTVTAASADLPEAGDVVSLKGKVHAQGRLRDGQAPLSMVTEQLDYNLTTQDMSSSREVEWSWAGGKGRGRGLRANIKSGDLALESQVNVTLAP